MPSFQVGDKVVYPNHGIGIVDQISTRTNGFQVERFYMLTIKASSLKVMVPCGNVLTVGLRRVVRQEEIDSIYAFLGDDPCSSNADWKERYREHCEKMKAGSLMEVAEVLKSLLVLAKKKPLGFREQKMLEKARYLLVNEITQAIGGDESTADDNMLAAFNGQNSSSPISSAKPKNSSAIQRASCLLTGCPFLLPLETKRSPQPAA